MYDGCTPTGGFLTLQTKHTVQKYYCYILKKEQPLLLYPEVRVLVFCQNHQAVRDPLTL